MYELEENISTQPSINVFGDWIKSIPMGEYPEVRKRILSECKITGQVFRFWKAGITKVPTLAQPIINQIAGRKIFEV